MSFPADLAAAFIDVVRSVRDVPPAPDHPFGAATIAVTSTVAPPVGIFLPPPPNVLTSATSTFLPTMATATELLASLTTATLSAAATATTTSKPDPDSPPPNGECRLLGPFALIVQLALGGLALLALVYKRWRERPQRPVRIWFFDVSKQVFGSVLVHIANVFMSMLTSGRFSVKLQDVAVSTATRALLRRAADEYTPNPCSFYLLNLGIDTTLGIPILVFLLRLFTVLLSYTPWGNPPESIQSGNYGRPPRVWWWLKQSVIYFCGLFGMKLCVLGIFLMLPWISRVGDWALSWTEGNERLQIFFVMMLFPLIMNALQYYIIDSFIKGKDLGEGGGEADYTVEDDSATTARDSPVAYEEVSTDDHEEAVEDVTSKPAGRRSAVASKPTSTTEYDPGTDGDSQTVVGGSPSTRTTGRERLPKELYPAE